MHQVCHDLDFIELAFAIEFVLELFLLERYRLDGVDVAISLAAHFSNYSKRPLANVLDHLEVFGS